MLSFYYFYVIVITRYDYREKSVELSTLFNLSLNLMYNIFPNQNMIKCVMEDLHLAKVSMNPNNFVLDQMGWKEIFAIPISQESSSCPQGLCGENMGLEKETLFLSPFIESEWWHTGTLEKPEISCPQQNCKIQRNCQEKVQLIRMRIIKKTKR